MWDGLYLWVEFPDMINVFSVHLSEKRTVETEDYEEIMPRLERNCATSALLR